MIYYILSIRILYYLLLEFFLREDNYNQILQEDNDPKYTCGKTKKTSLLANISTAISRKGTNIIDDSKEKIK